MMHKACQGLEKVLYYFWRSSIKFQGRTGQKTPTLIRTESFRTVTPVWIHQWMWNDAQSLTYCRRGALLFYKVIHQISRPHRLKHRWHESNLSKITGSQTPQICFVFSKVPLSCSHDWLNLIFTHHWSLGQTVSCNFRSLLFAMLLSLNVFWQDKVDETSTKFHGLQIFASLISD